MISDWALMQESAPAALVLHWYGPSTISATVAGVPVKLRQETDYPRQGRIVLHVEPGVETQFVLKLRIPYWSAATKCSVNGKAVAAQAGTYCALDRRWKPGDRVTLDLDMRLRAWAGERECAGKVSLYRGPFLLAADEGARALMPQNIRPGAWKAHDQLDVATLDAKLVETSAATNAALVVVDVTDGAGQGLRLCDFGSAGRNGATYSSWLPAKGASPMPFTPENPLRTTVCVSTNQSSPSR